MKQRRLAVPSQVITGVLVELRRVTDVPKIPHAAVGTASGIAGFAELAQGWSAGAPLGWDPDDATPVAQAVCFLLSDWASAITGEILHVDGGFHAMGGGWGGTRAW